MALAPLVPIALRFTARAVLLGTAGWFAGRMVTEQGDPNKAFKAMRALRAELPGILCSGYALPASRDQAISEGFADFLKKPFSSAELEALLIRVLGARMNVDHF